MNGDRYTRLQGERKLTGPGSPLPPLLGFFRKRYRRGWRFLAHHLRPLLRPIVDLRWHALDVSGRAGVDSRDDPALVRAYFVKQAGKNAPIDHVYIDVSVIDRNDAGTGIQRVVRSLRDHLPSAFRPNIRAEHVIIRDGSSGYVTRTGAPIEGAPGTVFLGLDFATDSIFRNREQLFEFKRNGGTLWFLLHDILPLSHPQWFTASSRVRYRRWLRVCAALADGFLCVSPVVAEQLKVLLADRYGRLDLPRVAVIQLGSDITSFDRELAPSDLPEALKIKLEMVERAALIVATLEPRKGHADVLDAFDILWAQGRDLPLVLIGRPGWNTVNLQDRIRRHPQFGRQLFWLEDVDDTALHAAYRFCRLVIVPSLAEGYGLPLDEALALGAPVLVRDIPVFRRHDGAAVAYFAEDATPAEIARQIDIQAEGEKPAIKFPPLRQWEDAAQQVAQELESDR